MVETAATPLAKARARRAKAKSFFIIVTPKETVSAVVAAATRQRRTQVEGRDRRDAARESEGQKGESQNSAHERLPKFYMTACGFGPKKICPKAV